MLIKNIDLTTCPNTNILSGLNQKIFAEMNNIAPGKLLEIPAGGNVILGGGATPCFVGGPTARAKLLAAIANRGVPMRINSAYRTVAQQFLLFREFHFGPPSNCGIPKVAKPGTSNHESGLALDIEEPWSWEPFLEAQGWKHLKSDPPHFDFIGGTDLRKLTVKAFQRHWDKNHPGAAKIEDSGIFGPVTENALLNTPVDGF